MRTAHEPVTRYWAAAEARDWDAFAALLSDDICYELPQTRKRIGGKARYLEFSTDFPADWHATLRLVIADGDRARSWCDFVTDGVPQIAVTFFELTPDGLV